VAGALDTRRRVVRGVRDLTGAKRPAPEAAGAKTPSASGSATPSASAPDQADRQVLALMRGEQSGSPRRQRRAAEHAAGTTARQAQLERIEGARASALANGEDRRATQLAVRADRVREELQTRAGKDDLPGMGQDRVRQHAAFLDAQALLPAQGRTDREGRRRDYAALSALVGYSRSQFEALDGRPMREARLEIDRELASRRERASAEDRISGKPIAVEAGASGSRPGSEDSSPEPAPAAPTSRPRHVPPPRRPPESDVMRDLRAVAEGRKRHLGLDRE
jgi:hypothetical protein